MKKLSAWARARSQRRKTQDSASERASNKDTGSTADSVSTNGHPIAPSSPVSDLHPVPSIPQHFLPRTSHDGSVSIQSGSNSRIRPVLIGVSRPSDTLSRPETAGSIQSAVNWAADRVAQSPTRSSTSPSRSQSTRHVDILSVTRPGLSFPLYNEDIATRNSEAAKHQFMSGSKYQEEIATRNAAPPLQSTSDQPKQAPNPTNPRTGSPLKGFPEQGGGQGNDKVAHNPNKAEAAAHEDRDVSQPSQPSVEAAAAAAAARTLSETDILQNDDLSQHIKLPGGPLEEGENYGQDHDQASGFVASNQASNIDALKVSINQKTNPDLDQGHNGNALIDKAKAFVPSKQPVIANKVPPSFHNAPSAKETITMLDNTILDSTGDDSEALSDESFTSASPGIWDDSKPEASVAHSTRECSAYMHYSGTYDVTPRKATSVNPDEGSSQSIVQHTSPSSFSSIKTLASLLPATQPETLPVLEPVPAPVVVPQVKESRKPASSKLYTVAETEPEVEDGPAQVAVPEVVTSSVVEPSVPISPTELTQPESSESTPTQAKPPPESQWPSDSTDPNSPYAIRTRDFALNPRKEVAVMRPQNIPSKNVERGRGTTRTTTRPPTKAKRVGTLPNGAIVPKPSGHNGGPNGAARAPITPVKSTVARHSGVFNEEAFQRKQEQARAALIKLQHSLNEDFENATPQSMASLPQTNGGNRHSNSSSSTTDGRPHAPPPTNSLGQVLGHPRAAASQASGPRTSLSISDPPTSPRSISSISSARQIHRHSPMQSLQETVPRAGSRKRGETISEMRRLVYEMTQPRVPVPNLPGQNRMYEPGLSAFPLTPEEVSLSSFPLPTSPPPVPAPPMPEMIGRPSDMQHMYQQHHEEPIFYQQHQQYKQPYPFTFEPYEAEAAPPPVIRPYSASSSRTRNRQKSTSTKKYGHSKTSSNGSQHSIPSHMIPDRGSSMRDASVADEEH